MTRIREVAGRVWRVVTAMPTRDLLMRLSLVFMAVSMGVSMLITGTAPLLMLTAFALALAGVVFAVVEVALKSTEEEG